MYTIKISKNILVFVFCILLFHKNSAQPNGGFENWITEFSYETPEYWQTMNVLSLTTPSNPLSAFKTSGIDKYSGFCGLKVQTIHVINNPAPAVIADTFGVVFKGKITVSPTSFKSGFSYNDRPEKLQFYSKYHPVGDDTALVWVMLKKWNGVSTDTIASGVLEIAPTAIFGLFEIPLIYQSDSEFPDSAEIAFFSSRDILTARVGSALFVDDVLFTGWVGIGENTYNQETIKLYPNPIKNELNIDFSSRLTNPIAIIYDCSGKKVETYTMGSNDSKIDLSALLSGFYFLEVRQSNTPVYREKLQIIH
jgi:hypothetical protein